MYEDHYGEFDFMRAEAPELPSEGWVNSKKLSLKGNLKNHIIVLGFWAHGNVACMPLLEHFKILQQQYKDDPVIFIGVHSSKFTTEQQEESVQNAITRLDITHPVLLDLNKNVWNAYAVNDWPTVVVIDAEGRTLYHAGDQMDNAADVIEYALKQGKEKKILPEKISIKLKKEQSNEVLSFPGKIFAQNDELLIADSHNNRILITKLTDTKATIQQEIGGKKGFKDGSFKTAQFNNPQGIVRVKDKIFVADANNHAIRLLDLKAKTVTTIAGTGEQAVHSYGKAALNYPWDVVMHKGSVYIAMAGSNQIWKMDAKTFSCELFAGASGDDLIDNKREQAWLGQPTGIASGDELYTVGSSVSSVRCIAKEVSTLMGKALYVFGDKDGSFDEALLQHPMGIDYDDGKVYIADTYNNAIKCAHIKTKKIATIVKDLSEPTDVVVSNNKLLIADTNNHVIKSFDLKNKKLTTLKIH